MYALVYNVTIKQPFQMDLTLLSSVEKMHDDANAAAGFKSSIPLSGWAAAQRHSIKLCWIVLSTDIIQKLKAQGLELA